MIAGVLLGPSLFGLLFPHAQAWLFPWDNTQRLRDTQSYLFPASQLGLALYLFVVGLEFRVDIIWKQLRSSHSSRMLHRRSGHPSGGKACCGCSKIAGKLSCRHDSYGDATC